MTAWRTRFASALLAALLGATAVTVAQQAGKPQAPTKKDPRLKLIQPWPTAEQLQARRLEAENRPLFATHEPLTLTMAADFKAVNKDHDPGSTKRYPAELRIARGSGQIDVIHVQLGARGHVRRMARTCDFVPLRVEFPKEGVKGTLFEGPSALKLTVQCSGGADYQQYLLREYIAYRIYNLITPRSFRARLANVTYVDLASNKTIATRHAMFLEDDGDVARRMEGRTLGSRTWCSTISTWTRLI